MYYKILIIIIFNVLNVELTAQWILQQTGTTSYLRDIEFINRYTGWVCGDGGTILKTTNAGTNWVLQIGIPNKPLSAIHPVDSNVVYCVGLFETIFKTTNGGANWQIIQNAPFGDGHSHHSVFFINENTGWIGSTGFYNMLKTTNGGISFDSVHSITYSDDLYFKDSLNGIGVSEVSYINLTSDGGKTWDSYTIAGFGDIYRISFVNNSDTGFVVADGSKILYRTIDFGTSWDSIASTPNILSKLYSSKFINANTGWIGYLSGADTGKIYKTTNAGATWVRQFPFTGSISVNDIYAYSDSVVWFCGGFGRIYHTTTGGDTTTNILQISNEITKEFNLLQNYPNPFNSETTIEFSVKEKGSYYLNVYNTLGELVFNAFDKHFLPGRYKYMLDFFSFSSGIYIYKLASKNLSISKKMLYVK